MMTIRSLRRCLNSVLKLSNFILLEFFINDGETDIGVYLYLVNTTVFIKCQYQDVLMYCVGAVDLRCYVLIPMRKYWVMIQIFHDM